ncbi:hypothetical protein B0H19DRAFT_1072365 [Mycena capillaripes]|nr:hypothetical protein B0H19DRAFT_1072365 [Mycena capillaripes]
MICFDGQLGRVGQEVPPVADRGDVGQGSCLELLDREDIVTAYGGRVGAGVVRADEGEGVVAKKKGRIPSLDRDGTGYAGVCWIRGPESEAHLDDGDLPPEVLKSPPDVRDGMELEWKELCRDLFVPICKVLCKVQVRLESNELPPAPIGLPYGIQEVKKTEDSNMTQARVEQAPS